MGNVCKESVQLDLHPASYCINSNKELCPRDQPFYVFLCPNYVSWWLVYITSESWLDHVDHGRSAALFNWDVAAETL